MLRNWCAIIGLALVIAVGCPSEPGPAEARDQLQDGLNEAQAGADGFDAALALSNREGLRSGLASMEFGMTAMGVAIEILCETGLGEVCGLTERPAIAMRAASVDEDCTSPRDPRCPDDNDDDYNGRNPYIKVIKVKTSMIADCAMADARPTAQQVDSLVTGWQQMTRGMQMLRQADVTWDENQDEAEAQAAKGLALFQDGTDAVDEALHLAPTDDQHR